MKSVKIAGLGKYLPSKVLTNADLEKIVDTSDEWITTRTGIKERHIVEKGQAASDLAFEAAKDALKMAGLEPGQIDLIVVANISPDTVMPSTATHLQNKLKAVNAACFDVSAACSGFIYASAAAVNFIRTGMYKHALVVGVEILSAFTDWEDRATCVLFGDGAGAAVYSVSEDEGVLGFSLGADSSQIDLLTIPAGGSRLPASHETVDRREHYIKMKGNELFRFAVRYMVQAAEDVVAKAGFRLSDVAMVIPHQANMRIIEAVAKRLEIDNDRFFVNVEKYGNMSSACVIIGLCEAYEQGRLNKGDLVLLDTFGGGLVWASMLVRIV